VGSLACQMAKDGYGAARIITTVSTEKVGKVDGLLADLATGYFEPTQGGAGRLPRNQNLMGWVPSFFWVTGRILGNQRNNVLECR